MSYKSVKLASQVNLLIFAESLFVSKLRSCLECQNPHLEVHHVDPEVDDSGVMNIGRICGFEVEFMSKTNPKK
jgi:hypothetical protein